MEKRPDLPYIVKWSLRFPATGTPRIFKQRVNLAGKKFVIVNEAAGVPADERSEYILLFFAEERHFSAYYTDLNEKRLAFLRSFYAVGGLDYSTYPGLDEIENAAAIGRNRRFCSFLQRNDVLCMYNVVWTGKENYDLAFDNVETGAPVVVSTYRIRNPDDDVFREGYLEMKKRIQPSVILCYGRPQAVMLKDVESGLVVPVPTRFRMLRQKELELSGQLSFLDQPQSAGKAVFQ